MNKVLLSAVAVTIFILGLGAGADDQMKEKEVVMPILGVMVPSDVKSQEPVRIVVNGMFPNPCYQWYTAKIGHEDTYTHVVQIIAKVKPVMCIQVMVPFTKEISLGKLEVGSHTLKFPSSDGTSFEKTLVVK